jgi:hypothetical protein
MGATAVISRAVFGTAAAQPDAKSRPTKRPRILPEDEPIRGLAVTSPTYWASVSPEHAPHYRCPPYSGTWDAQNFGFPAARREAALAVDFNTVRTFLNAAPFMDARTEGALNTTSELVTIMVENVKHFVAAGFKVILNYNAELSPPNPAFSRAAILDGPDGPSFQMYCAGLAEVCRGVDAAFSPEQVAIELINEPLFAWEWGDRAPWSAQAQAMWARARVASPHHTLIVQSRSAGYYGALAELDPLQFDTNTLFSFHPYDPGGFTHQGIGENLGLYRIPFPVGDTLHFEEAVSLMQDRVAVRSELSANAKKSLVEHNLKELKNIFDPANPMGPARMDRDWSQIDGWLARYGVSPVQVLAGEFGVTSDFNYNGSPGCDGQSRARFYRAVRENVEKHGFGGWIAWQSVGDFNLFDETSVHEHGNVLIPELVSALGLLPDADRLAAPPKN